MGLTVDLGQLLVISYLHYTWLSRDWSSLSVSLFFLQLKSYFQNILLTSLLTFLRSDREEAQSDMFYTNHMLKVQRNR